MEGELLAAKKVTSAGAGSFFCYTAAEEGMKRGKRREGNPRVNI
jgi:hypothetical protein